MLPVRKTAENKMPAKKGKKQTDSKGQKDKEEIRGTWNLEYVTT